MEIWPPSEYSNPSDIIEVTRTRVLSEHDSYIYLLAACADITASIVCACALLRVQTPN